MKTLMRALGVGALLLASACFYRSYEPVAYQYGYGGSGLNLAAVEDLCARTAIHQGWSGLGDADRLEQTSPYTAEVRFNVHDRAFRRHVTCYYDARTNVAMVR